MFREVLLQVCVFQVRLAIMEQAEADAQDDIATLFCGVEDAGPIGETAFGVLQRDDRVRLRVVSRDLFDRFRNLLPLGADVLHRRAADRSRNAAQIFNAGAVVGNGGGDEAVPFFARADVELDVVLPIVAVVDARNVDADDESLKTFVCNHEIAAAAQDEERQFARSGPGDRLAQSVFMVDLGEVASRTADAERSLREGEL